MTIQEALQIIKNKVTSLKKEKELNVNLGNLDKVVEIESAIDETQTTVDLISSLLPEEDLITN